MGTLPSATLPSAQNSPPTAPVAERPSGASQPSLTSTIPTTITLAGKVRIISEMLGLSSDLKMREALMEAVEQLEIDPKGNLQEMADACLKELGCHKAV